MDLILNVFFFTLSQDEHDPQVCIKKTHVMLIH